MITAILSAIGLTRSAVPAHTVPRTVRRVRWRGSDGRWHWQVA